MAELLASPMHGPGRRLHELLVQAIPDLADATSYEIRFAVNEPITLRITKFERIHGDFAGQSVPRNFVLREVGGG